MILRYPSAAIHRSIGNPMLLAVIWVCTMGFLFSGCLTPPKSASPTTADTGQANRKMAMQPGQLAPGLAVVYFRDFSDRHLDALPQGEKARKVGRAGLPIPILDHSFGRGKVFDSGTATLIGMRMAGVIHLSQAGRYSLQAFINDGIRVYIDGRLVVDEPQWERRGNRYTDPGEFDVTHPGWFPLKIEYFQRKGTATIKLFWRLPDGTDFEIIPATAYAHRPDDIGR